MPGLPSILGPGLTLVLCGTAVGAQSASRGHYYAGRGNQFWRLLHDAGLTPTLLSPEDDNTLPSYGIGLTDLAPGITQSHDRGLRYDTAALRSAMNEHKPRVLAFTSLTGGRAAARASARRSRPSAGSPGSLAQLSCGSCQAVAAPTTPSRTPRSWPSGGNSPKTSDADQSLTAGRKGGSTTRLVRTSRTPSSVPRPSRHVDRGCTHG